MTANLHDTPPADLLEESGDVKQPPGGAGNIFKGMKP
jgi:hypothetical protein